MKNNSIKKFLTDQTSRTELPSDKLILQRILHNVAMIESTRLHMIAADTPESVRIAIELARAGAKETPSICDVLERRWLEGDDGSD
jgi:hypothetical protein